MNKKFYQILHFLAAPSESPCPSGQNTCHQPRTTVHHNSLLVMLSLLAVKEKTPSLNPLYLLIVGTSNMKKFIKMVALPGRLKLPAQNFSRKSEGTMVLMFEKRQCNIAWAAAAAVLNAIKSC